MYPRGTMPVSMTFSQQTLDSTVHAKIHKHAKKQTNIRQEHKKISATVYLSASMGLVSRGSDCVIEK